MKNRTALVAFLLGLLVATLLHAPAPDLISKACAAGAKVFWPVASPSRKEFFADTQILSQRVAQRAARERKMTERATQARTLAEKTGAKWRRAVDARFPADAFDADLPAVIYDVAYGYVDADADGAFDPTVDVDLHKLWVNEQAEAKRNAPPAGTVIGWGE